MSVVFILVFAAILIAAVFLGAFIWSVKSGQYEDTYTPSVRMLFDDAKPKEILIQEEPEAKPELNGQPNNQGEWSSPEERISKHETGN